MWAGDKAELWQVKKIRCLEQDCLVGSAEWIFLLLYLDGYIVVNFHGGKDGCCDWGINFEVNFEWATWNSLRYEAEFAYQPNIWCT